MSFNVDKLNEKDMYQTEKYHYNIYLQKNTYNINYFNKIYKNIILLLKYTIIYISFTYKNILKFYEKQYQKNMKIKKIEGRYEHAF